MYNIKLLNKIAKVGLDQLDDKTFVYGDSVEKPDAILVRSAKMHDMEFNPELVAIGRAGAGVNNIPVDRCAENGIVVFNTPGANANGVKELTIAALLLASRGVVPGINWVSSQKGNLGVAALAEKEKSKFAGNEIEGKKLGVIGLGAIGGLVANSAKSLGMKVYGCDPFITVEAAWALSRSIEKAASYDDIFKTCEYITLHVPATKETTGMINAEAIEKMQDGVKIINLARAELVDSQAIIAGVKSGKIAAYITDFVTDDLIGADDRIICMPHLGASTEESEDKCAIMAANEISDYLTTGNIKNSVNFPNANIPHNGDVRICIMHKNIAGIISKITSAIASENVNIENMVNRSRGEYAYTIIEIIGNVPKSVSEILSQLDGVIRVRYIV